MEAVHVMVWIFSGIAHFGLLYNRNVQNKIKLKFSIKFRNNKCYQQEKTEAKNIAKCNNSNNNNNENNYYF